MPLWKEILEMFKILNKLERKSGKNTAEKCMNLIDGYQNFLNVVIGAKMGTTEY